MYILIYFPALIHLEAPERAPCPPLLERHPFPDSFLLFLNDELGYGHGCVCAPVPSPTLDYIYILYQVSGHLNGFSRCFVINTEFIGVHDRV